MQWHQAARNKDEKLGFQLLSCCFNERKAMPFRSYKKCETICSQFVAYSRRAAQESGKFNPKQR
jgi:hypothetical protein